MFRRPYFMGYNAPITLAAVAGGETPLYNFTLYCVIAH